MPLHATVTQTNSDVSRISDISISSYLRTTPIVPGANRNDMGNDLFLGGVKWVISSCSIGACLAQAWS